eukprot:TRINITY_DN15129_c0_g4_i1.p1 TRINITY_DN15129_c0_g4~~TRINITY_DN15129_c0_g4_i1.p1  ORF type:complete len:182 (+),score=38.51 TRINITY_DN15129_c0_g4_i1:59-604(+)
MAPGHESVRCMACPNLICENREAYRCHCQTEWHKFNSDQRMMGRQTLTEEEFIVQMGGGDSAKVDVQDTVTATEDKKKEEDPDTVSICVVFRHKEEKWSHLFKVPKGSTIMDLKKQMVKPTSPKDDVIAFSLKRGMIRVPHFETIDQDETFDFAYVGAEEGKSFLERDERRQREEAAYREG